MNDVIIRLIDLKYSANGFTTIDVDGNYNVYINNRLAVSKQQTVLFHELNHINNDDFYNSKDIETIEA
jgi:hypothetical protein